MSDEIKACPFCGSEAVLRKWWDFGTRYGVECGLDTCRAYPGDQFSQLGSHYRKTAEEAIAAWNRRAPDPRLAAAERVVEAAKGIGLAFPCGERARELVDAIVAYDKLRAAP